MGGALMIISGLVGFASVLGALVGFSVELSSGAAVGRSSSRAAVGQRGKRNELSDLVGFARAKGDQKNLPLTSDRPLARAKTRTSSDSIDSIVHFIACFVCAN